MRENAFSVRSFESSVASVLALLIGCSTGTLRTLLIPFAKDVSQATVSLVLMLPILSFGLMKAIGDLIAGCSTSSFRWREMLVIGILVYFLGTLIIFKSTSLIELSTASSLMGFGEGAVYSAFYVLLTRGRKREISGMLMGMLDGSAYIGYGIGAIVSGYVSMIYGLRNALLIALIFSTISILPLLLISDIEMNAEKEEQTEHVWSHRSVLAPCLVAHMSKLSDTLMWGMLPLFLLMRGESWVGIGYTQSAIMFAFALFTIFMGNLSDRLGRKISVLMGISISMVGVFGVFLENVAIGPSIFGVLFGVGTAMFYPVLPAVISDSVPEEDRGRYLSIYRGVRDLGYFSGVILLGLLLDGFGELVTLAFIIMLLSSSMILSTVYLKETRPVWSTYPLHLKHVEILEESLVEFREFIKELVAGNEESYKKHASRFKELERSMDELKYKVESEVWRSVIDRDRADMIRIVNRIDRVTMYLLETISRFSIAWESVPDNIRPMLLKASEKLLRAGTLLKNAVQNMRFFPEESLKAIKMVDEEEREYDMLHFKQLEELYGCRSNFDPISATMISEAIESMEYAMDELQEASHLVHSLMSKYFYIKI